ncbi:hypothetical protein EPI10_010816 [Gossypium australe]|uniref:Uncharacterized protein n=1 Tax=Gossypium australe TaxID=47621 RepID=A0A5B6W6I1_9ROSI|nr:hypothetical protein EPI10_010816 [Gossypium australe]
MYFTYLFKVSFNFLLSMIIMSNVAKLEFVVLDITRKNYLSWIFDAKINLLAKVLENTIMQGNKEFNQDKVKAIVFLRHYFHEGLKEG